MTFPPFKIFSFKQSGTKSFLRIVLVLNASSLSWYFTFASYRLVFPVISNSLNCFHLQSKHFFFFFWPEQDSSCLMYICFLGHILICKGEARFLSRLNNFSEMQFPVLPFLTCLFPKREAPMDIWFMLEEADGCRKKDSPNSKIHTQRLSW